MDLITIGRFQWLDAVMGDHRICDACKPGLFNKYAVILDGRKAIVATHRGVRFRFLSSDEDSELVGEVLVRQDANAHQEMVLDIRDPEGASPYLLVGRKVGTSGFFVGNNSASDRSADVNATWAEVEGAYVGKWTEDDDEFLFSFELG